MKTHPFKENVSETLLIPLICKAEETESNSPIITDYVACDILDKINIKLDKYRNKKVSRIGTAIRTKYFDEEVKSFIMTNKKPCIITLGCGLDARYDRLPYDIVKKAFFVYLDFYDVIKLRKKFIPERDNEIYLSGNMLDKSWIYNLKRICDHDYMFILEGVVMYIKEDDLRKFLNLLCYEFPSGILLFDALNEFLSRSSRHHDTVKYSTSNFVFGFDDDTELQKWNVHLQYKKTKLFTEFKECRQMGLVMYLLMKYIKKYKYASRMITYQINK